MDEATKAGNGWSIKEALSVIVIVLGLQFIIPAAKLTWVHRLAEGISPEKPLFGLIFLETLFRAVLIIFLIGVIIRLKYKLPWQELGLKPDRERKWFWVGLGQGLMLFIGVTVLTILLIKIYPFEIKPQAVTEVFYKAKTVPQMILIFFIVSVFAPISEELYFRGFLYPAMQRRLGRLAALIVANSIFGLMHLDLFRFIPITLGGIWLTHLYEKTGSLYTSITAHAVWNTMMIILVFLAA